MLSPENPYNVTTRKIMAGFLLQQVFDEDYSVLSKLYEMTKIDNKKLLEKAHMIRNIFDTPAKTIFSDMAYLIYDESENNASVIQNFYDLLRNIFPTKVKEYEYMIALYNTEDGDKWKHYLRNKYSVSKKYFLLYLFHLFLPLYYDDDIIINELADEYRESIKIINFTFFQTDHNIGDDLYKFNSGETILDSALFDKYVNKRKIELAEYLSNLYSQNVTENNLCQFIHKTLKAKSNKTCTPLSNDIDAIATGTTKSIIVEQNGGMTWYESITNDGMTGYKSSFNYCPDIEKLIMLYYKEYVKLQCRKYNEINKENFSKVYLSKYCIPNVQEAYTNIMYLYNMDVMCKIFNNIKDDYYLNFSWEKISHQDALARYNSIISEMEDSIRLLNVRLESEKQNKLLLKEQFMKKERSEDKALAFEHTVSKLNKKIDEKDIEIISLKRQLESKEEYIQLLQNKDDPDVVREIDVSLLQQKRYLFVGHANEAIPELRRTFPNSIFMDSENAVINNIQVDGIVMLIKYMSHAMFYKVNSSSLVRDMPIVRCNTKNINTVYAKMMDFFE